MSKATTARTALLLGLLVGLLVGACATGTNTNGSAPDATVQPHHDDASHVNADAPAVKMDAGVTPDAPRIPDAAVDAASSLFCTDNTMCTNSGECCITLGGPQGFCGTGVVILGECVPQ